MITDEKTGWVEAEIIINGKALSFAESLCVRVAISSFLMQMGDPKTRELLGSIGEGYQHHLSTVINKLHNKN